MADWYCGSVQYAAVAVWQATHAYTVGNIIRQTAPGAGSERCFRCTTAGTSGASEPAWNLAKGATTTSGTAVFTEVTGNSTYAWSAPHARLANAVVSGWPAIGDNIYFASDHNYSTTGAYTVSANVINSLNAPLNVICVNPAGSVPPVAADITTGGKETTTGTLSWQSGSCHIRGLLLTGAAVNVVGFGGPLRTVLDNCSLALASGGSQVRVGDANPADFELINTTMSFSGTGQSLQFGSGTVLWRDTPNAIVGPTLPTTLFSPQTNACGRYTVSGVDLSALGSGKTIVPATMTSQVIDFINCKTDPSVTVAATPTSSRASRVNLLSSGATGVAARNEIYDFNGTLTTETTIVRAGGASDGVTPVSWKVVTTARPARQSPMVTFPLAIWNGTVGTPVTATVEIINDGTTLTNADVWLEVEYLGASGAPLASLVTSAPATILTAGSSIATSSALWTATGLSTPVSQTLSVTFTPQIAGLMRAVVKLARASATIYVDPYVSLS